MVQKKQSKSAAKKQAKQQLREEAILRSFHSFYEAIYGKERWQTRLFPSLACDQSYSCLVNRHAHLEDAALALASVNDRLLPLADCFVNRHNIDLSVKCVILSPETDSQERIPVGSNSTIDTTNDNDNESAPTSNDVTDALQQDDDEIAADIDMVRRKNTKLPFPRPQRDLSGVYTHYLLDYASVIAANCLDVRPTDKVLDTCSAPGGKALVLFQRLSGTGTLHVNEVNGERRKHLRRVLQQYIPKDKLEQQVSTTSLDLTIKGSGKEFPGGYNHYDRVLVDAPCSSERHVIHNLEKELMRGAWTTTHSKTQAKRQRQILAEGIRCTKEGGKLLYATCSLSPAENDDVIEYVMRRYNSAGGKLTTTSMNAIRNDSKRILAGLGEPTKGNGWIFLPDTPGGWGPLYFCVIDVLEHPTSADYDDLDDN